MKIRNNSDREWVDYDCGTKLITIKPLSTFEVDDKTGGYLLRMLGSEKWLTRVVDETVKPEGVKVDSAKPEASTPAPAQATSQVQAQAQAQTQVKEASKVTTTLRKPNTSKKK